MLQRRQMMLSTEQFSQLYATFRDDYALNIEEEQLISMLRTSRLLVQAGDVIEFKYLYCYYYFAALYLANHLGDADVRREIGYLADAMYEEENANIMLFLTHLSKDGFVLDAMVDCANAMFRDVRAATLDDDIRFLGGRDRGVERRVSRTWRQPGASPTSTSKAG